MAALDGIRAKLDRAAQHLDNAKQVIRDFSPQQCRMEPELNPDTDNHDFIAHFPPVPPILSLVLGDSLHNIRTALDHLVWALVLSNPNRPAHTPNESTLFPIRDTEEGYRNQLKRGRILGVVEEAERVIDAVQPYHRGNAGKDYRRHPLWVLNALENIDKHRRLTLASSMARTATMELLVDGNMVKRIHTPRVREGVVVASLPRPTGDKPVRVQGELRCVVVFDEDTVFTEDIEVCSLLTTVRRYVRQEVLPRLALYLN